MPSTGIVMNDDVSKQWNFARLDLAVPYIKFGIANDTFAVQKIGQGGSSIEDFFKLASLELLPKEGAYVAIRSAPGSDKFILVFYMPNNARVHDKMVYAASMAELKQALGTDNLCGEISIHTPNECTLEEYTLSSHVHKKTELFTMNEILAYEALYSSQQGLENESKVSVDIPINVSPDALSAMKKVEAGQLQVVNFALNPVTEILEVAETASNLDQIASTYSKDEPRFTLANHASSDGSAICFIYYCPEKAKAKLKMFYSASKSLVLKTVASQGLEIRVNYECNEPNEVSVQAVEEILHPVVEEKKLLSKPKARGGAAGKRGPKFSDL